MRIGPAKNSMFKVNNMNTKKLNQICSKSIIKMPERRHDVVLAFSLLTLNIFQTFTNVLNVDFEQVFVCWVGIRISRLQIN